MAVFTFSRGRGSFSRLFAPRPPECNKYDFGRVLSVCGSVRFPGAAVFAASGAVLAGAGLVQAAFPEAAYAAIAPRLAEPVLLPLPGCSRGMLNKSALPPLLEACKGADAVLLGCGLGQSLGTAALVEELVSQCPAPMILDADALNLLSGKTGLLKERGAPTILTPHMGELARLTGHRTENSPQERIEAAHSFAREHGVTLVLKGAGTLVAQGGAQAVYLNKSGNPAMATAGSGDLLAGIMLAFLGRGLSPTDAAQCAVYVHGLCGDAALKPGMAESSLTPSAMLKALPRVLYTLGA
ncbi:MAG: NAD(P)H-hydrate dehydratase [Clostridium sp.]|jgi:NAD(P)H-hydrate epimerase|nr:NAD(P)H-hydrate dehydratase [Clostridium sp.]